MTALLIRGAEVNGARQDVRISDGRVREIGYALPRRSGEAVIDAKGGALLPGLTDHHLHLFATAAHLASLDCGAPAVHSPGALRAALHRATPDAHGWVRAVRYYEALAGDLDTKGLDALRADVPVRIQHRSGALWMLNSRAAQAVGLATADHPGVERDADGHATGRLWRADAWLRSRLPHTAPPSLAPLGHLLAGYGITSVTDATPDLDPGSLSALTTAHESGELPQRLVLLGAPDGQTVAGPRKLVLADSGLPDFDTLVSAISAAHTGGRPVAVHTVSRESLVLLLAALDITGALPGDRLEHASLIPDDLVATIGRLGLRVVTQPGFLADRGDDYLRDIPPSEHSDLYRCASLHQAGVPLALSSDAPYGPLDPWQVMSAAVLRRTPAGVLLSPMERLKPRQALCGYQSPAHSPGSGPRRVEPGVRADLLLLQVPLREALTQLTAGLVRLTLIGGKTAASDPRAEPPAPSA